MDHNNHPIDFSAATVLVVAPHPDDEVIGCGGFISKVKDAGGRVFVLFLTVATTNDFSSQQQSTEEERVKEISLVASRLGFDGWHLAFPGAEFHLQLDQVPQKQLIHEIERGEIISLEKIRPDVILFPLFGDYSQDHRAVTHACFTACRPAPRAEKFVPDLVLSYETPMHMWLHPNHSPEPNFFVELSEQQVEDKLAAMKLYKSQLRGNGHPRHLDTLHALAVARGSVIGTQYAEAFVCHRFVS